MSLSICKTVALDILILTVSIQSCFWFDPVAISELDQRLIVKDSSGVGQVPYQCNLLIKCSSLKRVINDNA